MENGKQFLEKDLHTCYYSNNEQNYGFVKYIVMAYD